MGEQRVDSGPEQPLEVVAVDLGAKARRPQRRAEIVRDERGLLRLGEVQGGIEGLLPGLVLG
jgi:hypothetical protein